jgi:hypothetical protein
MTLTNSICLVFAVSVATSTMMSGQNTNVDFDAVFRSAKEAPIAGTVVVQTSQNEILVMSGAHEYSLEGMNLLVQAKELRITGSITIKSYAAPAAATPGAPLVSGIGQPDYASKAGDGSNGASGGDGPPGNHGDTGTNGLPAGLIRIEVDRIFGSGSLQIVDSGQAGGKGQKGGQGGTGGHGQKGGTGDSGATGCNSGGGNGGPGGMGGKGGTGGTGGIGGKGGCVILACAARQGIANVIIKVDVGPSSGGEKGDGGNPGTKGDAGQGGNGAGFCGGGRDGPERGPGPPGDDGLPGEKGVEGKQIIVECQEIKKTNVDHLGNLSGATPL